MGWGWGSDDDEQRRRQQEEESRRRQEEELRRRKEEQLKKTRANDEARRKAKEAKKLAIAAKQKRLKQQEEMDKEIAEMMDHNGAEEMDYDKRQKQGNAQSNTLARGMLDSIFGASSGGNFGNQNRGMGGQISAPGKPIIGFQREQKQDSAQQNQKEDTFSGKPTTKLWRPL